MSNSISVAELKKSIAANSGLTLIDVRTPAEFEEVHIPEAKNVSLERVNAQSIQTLGASKDKPVYLVCHSGARSQNAASQLSREGFAQTFSVDGGTQAWIQAGYPVSRGKARVISLERQVRIAAGSLVLTGVLLSLLVQPHFIWLSAFVGAGLIFAGITDWCGMGLLLMRMPWNQK